MAAPTQKELGQLRQDVLTAVWGMGRRLRAAEVVLTLLLLGHRSDPSQVIGRAL